MVLGETSETIQKVSDQIWEECPETLFIGHDVVAPKGVSMDLLKRQQTILTSIDVDMAYAEKRHVIYYQCLPVIDQIPETIQSLAVIFQHGSNAHEQARDLWKSITTNDRFDPKYFHQDTRGQWTAK